ncbi:MAG: hypothetical protein R3314_03480 [Longimicrobiales bacterium]|nr:hypothetical protein [Longimicrobiales bacterium]
MAAVIRRRLATALGVLLLVSCDYGTGPDRARIQLVLLPQFAEQQATGHDGTSAALLVDNVRLRVVDEVGDTVVARDVDWPVDEPSLRIDVALHVEGEQQFEFLLEGRQAGTVLFTGRETLTLSADEPRPAPAELELLYAGPGAALLTLDIIAPGEALLAGDQLQLAAAGTDDQGTEVLDPLMVWTSLDTRAATIDTAGVVRVGHDATRRARIVGRVAFRQLADTLELPVVPADVALARQPDTIVALGFDQVTEARPVGVNGDPVRTAPAQWTLRNPDIARIVAGHEVGTRTRVRAVAEGESWLVVSVSGVADSARVVVDQRVAAAAPQPLRAIMVPGDSIPLALATTDAGGSVVTDPPAATWASSDPAVAAVSPIGVVTAVSSPGPVTGVLVAGEVNGTSYDHRVEVADAQIVGPAAAISVGDGHGCWVGRSGERVFCHGDNQSGQLGDGTLNDAVISREAVNPLQGLGDLYTQVSTGGAHTCAILDTVGGTQPFCWGDNRRGQLGDGTITSRSQPTPVSTSGLRVDLTSIRAGGGHTCALSGQGAVYCWGDNEYGQLGLDSLGGGFAFPVLSATGLTFTQLTVGWLHTCGLSTDGAALCWGRATEGQLGTGSITSTGTPTPVAGTETYVELETGASQSCGITATGGLECWGYNSSGQVGVGSTSFEVTTPTPVTFPAAVTISDVALGRIHGCALASTGPVYCWGGNDELQLGQASPRATRTPLLVPLPRGFVPTSLAAGGNVTCAMDGTRTICWGGVPAVYLGRGS